MITLIAATSLLLTPSVEILPNGVSIIAIPREHTPAFSAQLFIKCGSAYETTENSGGFHLLEHLLFADGVADEIAEKNGFIVDGSTYREFMRLHAIGPADKWKFGIEAIARLLQDPGYSAIERESNIIAEESRLALLNPDETIQRLLWQSSAPNPNWARPAIGVFPLPKLSEIQNLFQKFMVGPNVVVVVSGEFAAQDAFLEMRQRFAFLPPGTKASMPEFGDAKIAAVSSPGQLVGVGFASPGLKQVKEWLAHEVALEALLSPVVLDSVELEARKYSGPSANGALSIVIFESPSSTENLRSRVESLLPPRIDVGAFEQALGRVKLRFSTTNLDSSTLMAGVSIIFTGRQIDFSKELETVTMADVQSSAEKMTKTGVSWCIPK